MAQRRNEGLRYRDLRSLRLAGHCGPALDGEAEKAALQPEVAAPRDARTRAVLPDGIQEPLPPSAAPVRHLVALQGSPSVCANADSALRSFRRCLHGLWDLANDPCRDRYKRR